jgi:hypothetical protein
MPKPLLSEESLLVILLPLLPKTSVIPPRSYRKAGRGDQDRSNSDEAGDQKGAKVHVTPRV